MANKRTISWNAAMRDFRRDRVRRDGVREERLRATAGLRSSPALSSWRGRSGRRYIVGVHPLMEEELLDIADAVVLAVRRDGAGTAHVVDALMVEAESKDPSRSLWIARMRDKGASELHVHRLAETEALRRAVVADLREDGPQASS